FVGNVSPDWYTYTVTQTGYATAGPLGPLCVAAASTATGSATLTAPSTCVSAKNTASTGVTITVVDESGNAVNGAKIQLTNQDGNESPGSTTVANTSNV